LGCFERAFFNGLWLAPEPQSLVNGIDDDIRRGRLTPPDQPNLEKRTSRLSQAFFLATHLSDAVRAWRRKATVGLEIEAPPADSTFEDFSQLSLYEATKILRVARH